MTDIHIGRRTFIKKAAAAAAAVTVPGIIAPAATGIGRRNTAEASASTGNLIVPIAEGLKITGTFLDEISHDIPHQNWGEKEWDADFRHMKSIGIDGKKAIMGTGKLTNDQAVSVAEHETNCGTGRHHTRQAQRTTLPTI